MVNPEDVRHLKEGEIYIDQETGKRYRVHKTVFPSHMVGGPQNKGDPNDRTLRRMEADVVIPDLMNKQIEQVECYNFFRAVGECLAREGNLYGLALCKTERDVYDDCKREKFNDPLFREKVTEKFLADRAYTRRTGKPVTPSKFEAYLDWKREQMQKQKTS